MKFTDYLRLAYRNLSRQKSRTFLTITAITIGSLSVILMASIIISVRQSLMDSFQKMGAFDLVTLTQDPNATDTTLISAGNGNGDSSLKQINDATLATVRAVPHVTAATVTTSPWAKTLKLEGSDKKQWSDILAYDPDSGVFTLPLLAGRTLAATDMDKIVVGSNFLHTYGDASNPTALLGKHVELSMNGGMYPDWGAPPPQPPQNADKSWYDSQQKQDLVIQAEIVGVVDNATMDDKQNYVSLAWARRLETGVSWQFDDSARKACEEQYQQHMQQQKFQQGAKTPNNPGDTCGSLGQMKLVKDDTLARNGYGSIIIKADTEADVKGIADRIGTLGYGATTAQNMIDQINQIFTMISIVLGAIGGISLFVAAIGIINTMIMATLERVREIGVMRACGATRATIRRLFTFEAALLGFWGGVFGLVISVLLANLAKFLVQKFATGTSIPIDRIGDFPLWLVAGVIVFTTLVGLVSGLGPAIKAARMNPVEALRYE